MEGSNSKKLFETSEIERTHKIVDNDSDVTDAKNCFMNHRSVVVFNKNYNMSHPSRGKAIIFNHYRFINDHKERKGTASDVKNLTKALVYLGFQLKDIVIHDDLSASDISDELRKVQKEDHANRDLLMIFVLTHGSRGDKISAYDVEYQVESLWEPFTANKCRTLAGKPKIFFVIACRGDSVDPGQNLPLKDESVTEVDAKPIEFSHSYSIPVWSDFLYIFSTYKGYYSYRHKKDGTWYIQAFCEELFKTNLSQVSFTDFLTAVNGRVSRLFETGSCWDPKKQTPIFSSTLTKNLYFKTKENKI